MTRRVVISGLGVIAPNGNGIADFELALRKGQSGIRYQEVMEEAKFACRVRSTCPTQAGARSPSVACS